MTVIYLYTFLIQIYMRIFVTCNNQTGTPETIRITISQSSTTQELLNIVALQFKICKQFIILKLKNERITLRIIENWPIKHYPISSGSRFIVQQLQGCRSPVCSPIRSLTKIEQELQLELDAEYSNSMSSQKVSDLSFDQGEWEKYLENSLELFLEAIRDKSLEKVSQILKKQPKFGEEHLLDKMIQIKNKYLLDEIGVCGKSALHWAIHQKDLDIVEFLLIKSCNPNIISLDQYSPLQLSIFLKLQSIFQTLISHPKIDINQLTAKGTALHVALHRKQQQFILKLVECGADISITDNDGKSAYDLSKQLKIDLQLMKKKKRVEIPYISRGAVFRVSTFSYRHKFRLLLVNPFTNQLIIYNINKQIELSLKINAIKRAKRITEKKWLMKKEYYYFQMFTLDGVNLIFAFRYQQICDKWIQQINKAIQFTSLKNSFSIKSEQQLIQSINDEKNQIQIHKKKAETKKSVHASMSILDLKPILEDEEKHYSQLQQKRQEAYKQIEEEKETTSVLISERGSVDESYRDSDILGSIVSQRQLIQVRNRGNSITDSLYGSVLRQSALALSTSQLQIGFKDFKILRQLGNGSFGRVFLARYEKTEKLYALKVLSKKKLLAKKQLKYAIGQANILKKMNHPFIIQLSYSFETPNNLYMALDYCPYGDLSELLCEEQSLSEQSCRFFIGQIILAVEYLHNHNIIYRDLKPENILITKNGFIKLTDFGLSKEKKHSMSFCGSPAYLSPEMLEKKGVGTEADIYGIGCIFYEMLVGQPPYFNEDLDQLFDNIKNGKLKFPSFISKQAKLLITSLLQRDITNRIGIKDMNQIKNHEFFDGFEWDKLETMQMNVPTEITSQFQDDEEYDLEVIKDSNFKDTDYDGPHVKLNRIKGFAYIRQWDG